VSASQNIAQTVFRLRRRAGLTRAPGVEPTAGVFHVIRLRLALWFGGALAVFLLVSGVVLYVSVRQSLMGPVQDNLVQASQSLAQTWQSASVRFPLLQPCATRGFAPSDTLYVCYDVHGHILGVNPFLAQFATRAADGSLVSPALKNGAAEDTYETRGPLGTLERYAVKVPGPPGQGALGVVLVAQPVGPQLQTLDTLLKRLLLLGITTMLLAAASGLWLANRALLPARLALTRQRDFIADASHELRTPLTMLRSNVEVVLRGKDRLPPEDVELLEDTVGEAKHLATLANSMLDLARLDREDIHLEADVVDLTELAVEGVRWAGTLAVHHDLNIRAENSEPVLVLGDATLLRQATLILIDNAVKYNRPGGEVIVRSWAEGSLAYLEVRDNGIGIETAHIAHLGERFYRVDKARSRESGGAGLGLSIVRRIIARHHGSFTVASEPDAGTTATLALPSASLEPQIA
jgi:signal transduction histidine kinase